MIAGQTTKIASEASPAQDILKRLIEAEEQARLVLQDAERHADEAVQQAREEAQRLVDEARQEGASRLQARLAEVESASATQMKQRLAEADRKSRDFELQAAQNLSAAVQMVVNWVTGANHVLQSLD